MKFQKKLEQLLPVKFYAALRRGRLIFLAQNLISFFVLVVLVSPAVHARAKGPGELLGQASQSQLPDEFTVAVWNIAKNSDKQVRQSMDGLLAKAQVLLLQEFVLSEAHLKLLGSRLQWFEGFFAKAFFASQWDAYTGTVNFATPEALALTAWRSKQTEPLAGTPKTAVIQSLLWGLEQQIHIVNVHAINFVTDFTYEQFWLDLSQELAGLSGPMIIAGDMNTWSHSRMEILQSTLLKLGLQRLNFPGDEHEMSLDQVFLRGVAVETPQRLHSVKGSDHSPMIFGVKSP